jgi:hypothetical protein
LKFLHSLNLHFDISLLKVEKAPEMEGDRKMLGAHDGGIPPGWDFPAARKAAEDGIDLWLLDATLKMSPWERICAAASAARLAEKLRQAGIEKYGA